MQKITVRVASNESAIGDNRDIPASCLQHLMAVMLIDKTVTFKSAREAQRMKDQAVLRHGRKCG